jgi:hypothetical protein
MRPVQAELLIHLPQNQNTNKSAKSVAHVVAGTHSMGSIPGIEKNINMG